MHQIEIGRRDPYLRRTSVCLRILWGKNKHSGSIFLLQHHAHWTGLEDVSENEIYRQISTDFERCDRFQFCSGDSDLTGTSWRLPSLWGKTKGSVMRLAPSSRSFTWFWCHLRHLSTSFGRFRKMQQIEIGSGHPGPTAHMVKVITVYWGSVGCLQPIPYFEWFLKARTLFHRSLSEMQLVHTIT